MFFEKYPKHHKKLFVFLSVAGLSFCTNCCMFSLSPQLKISFPQMTTSHRPKGKRKLPIRKRRTQHQKKKYIHIPSFACLAFCASCSSCLHLAISSSLDKESKRTGPFLPTPASCNLYIQYIAHLKGPFVNFKNRVLDGHNICEFIHVIWFSSFLLYEKKLNFKNLCLRCRAERQIFSKI